MIQDIMTNYDEAMEILRALVGDNPPLDSEYESCVYCEADTISDWDDDLDELVPRPLEHADTCRWARAKAFVDRVSVVRYSF